MVLQEYLGQVRRGLKMDSSYPVLPHLALGLTGEAGEVADQIKKSQYVGNRLEFDKLEEELGDVLWYLQAFCNQLGLTLEDLARKNIRKLAKRYPETYTPIP
jgi:NTP pyrophosphatase (non-canonical NTP hydrolase)